MPIETVLLFYFTTFMIASTPGPNMLLAFQHGMNYGIKRTTTSLLGLSSGLLVLLIIALFGLNIISKYVPDLLTIIKAGGAIYLAYLGIKTGLDAFKSDQLLDENSEPVKRKTETQLFLNGFIVALSNPKAILFFAAFLPKFINFSKPLSIQYLILTIIIFTNETTWQLIYSFGGQKLANWLQTGNRLGWLNISCGALFIIIACGLFWDVITILMA